MDILILDDSDDELNDLNIRFKQLTEMEIIDAQVEVMNISRFEEGGKSLLNTFSEKYDLILLDIDLSMYYLKNDMQNESGETIAKILRVYCPDIPIILITNKEIVNNNQKEKIIEHNNEIDLLVYKNEISTINQTEIKVINEITNGYKKLKEFYEKQIEVLLDVFKANIFVEDNKERFKIVSTALISQRYNLEKNIDKDNFDQIFQMIIQLKDKRLFNLIISSFDINSIYLDWINDFKIHYLEYIGFDVISQRDIVEMGFPDLDIIESNFFVKIAKWTLHVFMNYPGYLYDENYASVYLGLSIGSFQNEQVQKMLSDALYNSIFNIRKFWWHHKLDKIIIEKIQESKIESIEILNIDTKIAIESLLQIKIEYSNCNSSEKSPADILCLITKEPVSFDYSMNYNKRKIPKGFDQDVISHKAIRESDEIETKFLDEYDINIYREILEVAQE
jgi:CheY-like chemotaxis protein